MKKILFCYFHPSKRQDYTPIDIGYILASIKDIFPTYIFEIVQMSYNAREEDSNPYIKADLETIRSHNTEAVFFFLDNVFWSAAYALGRAKKISSALKKMSPKVFIGFQSYRIQESDVRDIFDMQIADCIIKEDPFYSFKYLNDILHKKMIKNVIYKSEDYRISGNDIINDNCDPKLLPSPYLCGIFDDFLRRKQAEFHGNFGVYLYSSRGCPFKCHYCIRGIRNTNIVFCSACSFYDEIEYLYNNFGIRTFKLLDDVFIINKARLEELSDEFETRKKINPGLKGIFITAMIRPELVSDAILSQLKKINVGYLQLGLQTLNPNLREYMNRNITESDLRQVMDSVVKNNIKLNLDVIMGLPNDNFDYYKKTLDFAIDRNPTSIQVKQLLLNPGTHFHRFKEEYGIMVKENCNDFKIPFVYKASGEVNEKYFKEAVEYTQMKIALHPEIKWRLVTSKAMHLDF
jgi:radical SAM superfamily enzyme YgiQ (UPF0313 family)